MLKQYLKYYPNYIEYQDEDFDNKHIFKQNEDLNEEYYEVNVPIEIDENDENNHYYTDISEHSNVKINKNYKFICLTQKDQYVR